MIVEVNVLGNGAYELPCSDAGAVTDLADSIKAHGDGIK